MRPRIIACGIFKTALESEPVKQLLRDREIRLLPAQLHLYESELRERLLAEMDAAKAWGLRPLVLYGECVPGLDEKCRQRGACRVPGCHCFEMLLGRERYEGIMDECPGTFFVERELLSHFEEYCIAPLELHDETMRRYFFKNYSKLLYLRQKEDPDLQTELQEAARWTGLRPVISDVDSAHLARRLKSLILKMEAGE